MCYIIIALKIHIVSMANCNRQLSMKYLKRQKQYAPKYLGEGGGGEFQVIVEVNQTRIY